MSSHRSGNHESGKFKPYKFTANSYGPFVPGAHEKIGGRHATKTPLRLAYRVILQANRVLDRDENFDHLMTDSLLEELHQDGQLSLREHSDGEPTLNVSFKGLKRVFGVSSDSPNPYQKNYSKVVTAGHRDG